MSSFIAKDMLMFATEEYYRADDAQYTVHCFDHHHYEDILNDVGKEILEGIRHRVRVNDFKVIIDGYRLERKRSGTWVKNINHPRYDPKDTNAVLCSWNNLVLTGEIRNHTDNQGITSSFVRFYDEEGGWVSTLSGSLYRLGTNYHTEQKKMST